jgi:hypothetical protein
MRASAHPSASATLVRKGVGATGLSPLHCLSLFCKCGYGVTCNAILRPHVVYSMRYGLQHNARRCNRFFGHLRSAGDLRDLEQNLLPERARRRVLQKLTSVLGCAKTDYPPTRGGRAGGRTQRDCVPSSTWPVPSRGSRVPAACHVDVALRNVIHSLVATQQPAWGQHAP